MLHHWRARALLGVGLLLFVGHCAADDTSPSTTELIESIRSQSIFFETFNDDGWETRWTHTSDPKYIGRFVTAAAKQWTDKGLKMSSSNSFYGLSAPLPQPPHPLVGAALPLVLQYEVRHEAGGGGCGGAYLKLLSADPALRPERLGAHTPYSLMFGPDRCGGQGKVHLILRHRHPRTGRVSEHSLAAPPAPEGDHYTHVYTLRMHPDHRYEVLVDGAVRAAGDLRAPGSLAPPLLPPRELPDPADTQPHDWVEESTLPDPAAVKPADWDEREQVEDDKAVKPKGWLEGEPPLVDDPAAKKPAEWDDEEDGEWERPQLPNPRCRVGCGPWRRPLKPNPAYRGPWQPPRVPNPDYKGPWVPRRIPNPDFFEDPEPLQRGVAPVAAVALELWSVEGGTALDNILITRQQEVAERAMRELWRPRHGAEVAAYEAQLQAQQERARGEADAAGRRRGGRGGRVGRWLERLTAALLAAFEDGSPLAPLSPALAPLLGWLRGSPQGAGLLLGALPLLALTGLALRRARGKQARAPAGGAAEEEEDSEKGEEEEPAAEGEAERSRLEEEGKEEEGADTGGGGEAAAPAAGEGKVAEEIAAGDDKEDEEEEQVPPGGGPRRRTRRAA